MYIIAVLSSINQVSLFFNQYPAISYKSGQMLLSPQTQCSNVFYIKSGFVRQWQVNRSGDVFSVHLYHPGNFFPLPNILTHSPVSCYFESDSLCSIVKVPSATFEKFILLHPSVSAYINRKLSFAILETMDRLENITLGRAFNRTCHLLIQFTSLFGLSLPLSHRQVASWTGISRETTSLHLELLHKQRIIENQHCHIVIRDLNRLRQYNDI